MELEAHAGIPPRNASLGRIVASGLAFIEGSQQRIAGLSLTVRAGEVVALSEGEESERELCLGLLAGRIRPTFGVLRMCGITIRSAPPDFLLGTNLATLPADAGLTSGQWLQQLAGQAGYSAAEAGVRSTQILDSVALADQADTRIRELSSQQQTMLRLGAATVADPPIIIVQRPLRGLDVHHTGVVRKLLYRWSLAGKAVLLSGDLAELAEVDCDRLYLLRGGQITARANAQYLQQHLIRTSGLDDQLRSNGAATRPDGHTADRHLGAGRDRLLGSRDRAPSSIRARVVREFGAVARRSARRGG